MGPIGCSAWVCWVPRCWPPAAGGEQVETFRANRLIAFGDETSVINPDGSKYSVNAVQTADNTKLDCSSNALWIQTVGSVYGLVFPECNLLPVANPVSRNYATVGARAADIGAQIDLKLAADPFTEKDMVTMLVGANDILAQYAQYPGVPEAQLRDQRRSGRRRTRRAGQPHRQPRRQGAAVDRPRHGLHPVRPDRERRQPRPQPTCWRA